MKPDIRELHEDDAAALHEFFARMPAEDRSFFFWDVDDPAVARQWTSGGKRVSRAMFDTDGAMLAFAALSPGADWSSHVASLVLAVSPARRREGLGKVMARAMLIDALQRGYRKVTVMIAAENEGPIKMFREIGFEGEGLLRDHLRSPEDGSLHDVMLLAHLADENWSSMLTAGIQEALT